MISSSLDKEQKEFQDPELNMKYLNLQFLSFNAPCLSLNCLLNQP